MKRTFLSVLMVVAMTSLWGMQENAPSLTSSSVALEGAYLVPVSEGLPVATVVVLFSVEKSQSLQSSTVALEGACKESLMRNNVAEALLDETSEKKAERLRELLKEAQMTTPCDNKSVSH